MRPNAVEYEEHKPHSVGRKTIGMLLFVGVLGNRTAFEFRCLNPDRWEIHVDQIHKNTEETEQGGNFWLSCDSKEVRTM